MYRVSFDRRAEAPARFGERYVFRLDDAIDDLPEYLADYGTLVTYARPSHPCARGMPC
jgi:hypothetical protein